MIKNLVIAESPNELQTHDTSKYVVRCLTFYLTPLHNINKNDTDYKTLKNYDELLTQRVCFTSIKHPNNRSQEFPSFCDN